MWSIHAYLGTCIINKLRGINMLLCRALIQSLSVSVATELPTSN